MNDEDVVHIFNRTLLIHIKNEIMLCVATWMDLEIIILNEVKETKKTYIIWYCLYMVSKKMIKWTYTQNRNKATDIETQTHGEKYESGEVQLGDWA